MLRLRWSRWRRFERRRSRRGWGDDGGLDNEPERDERRNSWKLRRGEVVDEVGWSGEDRICSLSSWSGYTGGVITSWPKVSDRRNVISGGGGEVGMGAEEGV